MAFADLGSLGAIGNTNNNQTALDLVTSAAIAIGDFVVVVVAADNIANGGDDNATSGVTLGIGGQALTKGVQIANALAAQAGASSSIWYGIATGVLASGGTIRATFGSGTLVDASAATARKFSVGAGNTVSVEGTPGTLVGNTAADPGSLNVTTANIECLRVRGIASQVGNNTNLTPTASWTAWANGNSAATGTTAEICARAESRIVTGTGAASDPTYVSAIYASTYVAFKETLATRTATLNLTEAADTIAATGTLDISGTLGLTEASDTLLAAGDVLVSGTFSATEANDTLASTGNVGDPAVTGTLNLTEANDTLVATAGPVVGGTLSVTEAADTLSAAGGVTVRGTLGLTEASDTLASVAGVGIGGTLAVTEASDTLVSLARVVVGGTLAVTEVSDTLAATGTVAVGGTLSLTEVSDTIVATAVIGSAPAVGTVILTEADDTLAAAGAVVVGGMLSVVEVDDTLVATGDVAAVAGITGTLNLVQANQTFHSNCHVPIIPTGPLFPTVPLLAVTGELGLTLDSQSFSSSIYAAQLVTHDFLAVPEFIIRAESRVLEVPGEWCMVAVPASNERLVIPTESRLLVVSGEERTIEVPGEWRTIDATGIQTAYRGRHTALDNQLRLLA